jgi:hypothetical protein
MFWEHTVGYSPPKKVRKKEERVEKYINISRVAGQCRSSVINDDVAIPNPSQYHHVAGQCRSSVINDDVIIIIIVFHHLSLAEWKEITFAIPCRSATHEAH